VIVSIKWGRNVNPVDYNYVACPYDSYLYRNLSSNAFNGTIDPANVFSGSMNLTELDLSHNNFIGHMPNLGLLSALQSL
jgi:hypothetical protein